MFIIFSSSIPISGDRSRTGEQLHVTQIITSIQLANILKSLEGQRAYFTKMLTQTVADTNVKSRLTLEPIQEVFGCDKIYKLDNRNLLINASYESMVRIRQEKAGIADPDKPFVSKKPKGNLSEPIGKCLLRRPDGSMLVRTYNVKHKNNNARWVRPDGSELTPNEVDRLKAEFLPPKKN